MRRALKLIGLLSVLVLPACGELFGPSYRYGSVTVEVLGAAGEGIPGVGLTLYTGSHHVGYGATDAAGEHTFQFVPAGWYGVAVSVPAGWTVPEGGSNVRILDVVGDEDVRVEVRIAPGAPTVETSDPLSRSG